MKYRVLNNDELEIFRNEFVSFLVVNGITADDWGKLKTEDPAKNEKLVRIFSDHVFDTVLRDVKYLEIVVPGSIKTFQCLDSKILLVAFDTDPMIESNSVKEIISSNGQVYFKEKDYSVEREKELFDMIINGCSISDGTLFKKLSLLL